MLCSTISVLLDLWKRFQTEQFNWKQRRGKMATTIHDVARAAEVGIGTVSRVINNYPGVKPATREKVLATIAQLNYKPNALARSMISKRTNSIGVVVPFFTRPFNIEMLRGVEAELARVNKDLVIYNVDNDNKRDHYFSELPMRDRVDGLLILSLPISDTYAQNFKQAGMQVVLVDSYSPYLTSLVVDNVTGSYHAVKFLLEQGHRSIGFVNGITEGSFKFNQANDRLIGLHRAFGDFGLPFEPEMVVTNEWNRQGGREAALKLLKRSYRPTAIFAASDMQAVGVLEAARALDIQVPEELSVMGYDGIEVSELLGISTIQQPMRQMGSSGISKLIEHSENPSKLPELIRLDTTLITRRTTAKPCAKDHHS